MIGSIKENKKIISIFSGIIIIGLFTYFYTRDTFICPEDLSTQREKMDSLRAYTNNFMIKRPGSSVEDFFEARYEDLKKHNCQKTLDHIASSSAEQANY